MNLVINARDAMPGGGQFTIKTEVANVTPDVAERHAHAGSYAILSATDTGVGMEETTQKKIFDPFFSTKASDKGTGLGLSTVYGIMQQLGGYISVESQPGQGTCFRLCFPLYQGD